MEELKRRSARSIDEGSMVIHSIMFGGDSRNDSLNCTRALAGPERKLSSSPVSQHVVKSSMKHSFHDKAVETLNWHPILNKTILQK
jgi:hypothetical protein